MKGVESSGDGFTIHFDHDEAGLLAGVVDQLTEILDQALPSLGQDASSLPSGERGAGDDPADPFAQWEAEFSVDTTPTVDDMADEVDPVVRRLFPDAYPDDPAASHDFRRFTQAGQCRTRLADARQVVADLQRTDRRGLCEVPAGHLAAWLKTLAGVRVALAVRLDITDEVSADEASQRPEDDPRAWLYEVYAWTGWLQECILGAV